MRALFIRHGKDDAHRRGGWSNEDLSEEGVRQIRALTACLAEANDRYSAKYIVTSDLRRAMHTAEILADALKIPLTAEKQLREMNNGALAGMLNEQAKRLYPSVFFDTLQLQEHYPDGESPEVFFARIQSWFSSFLQKNRGSDKTVLVVTHGGVIRILYHIVRAFHGATGKTASALLHLLDLDAMEMEELLLP